MKTVDSKIEIEKASSENLLSKVTKDIKEAPDNEDGNELSLQKWWIVKYEIKLYVLMLFQINFALAKLV